MICSLNYPKEQQSRNIGFHGIDLAILQAVALPILSCFAAWPAPFRLR